MLLDGVMCRFKRQITQLHEAGDFVDLQSFSLKRLDHSIMTLARAGSRSCRMRT